MYKLTLGIYLTISLVVGLSSPHLLLAESASNIADLSSNIKNIGAAKSGNSGVAPVSDPRMPPVVPGEEVQRNGQKIKVWSTSGSPSVNIQPPESVENTETWTIPDKKDRDISVIVDGRDLLPGKGSKPYRNDK